MEKAAGGEGFTLTYDTAAGIRTVNAKSVVSTAPAHALKGELTPVMPQADQLCDKIRAEVRREAVETLSVHITNESTLPT